MKIRKSLVAAALAASMALPAASVQAGAIADSYLYVSQFALAFGDGAINGGTAINPATAFSALAGANSGDVSASLYGAPPATDTANLNFTLLNPFGGAFALNQSQGAGYLAGTNLTGIPAATFAGSNATLTGNSLVPGGATSLTDNQVSLQGQGVGSAQSNTGLNARATFVLAQATSLQLSFWADAFLRTMVDLPSGSAEAAYTWNMSLVDAAGDEIASWNGGTAGIGGTVYSSAFSLNRSRSAFGGDDFTVDPLLGYFEFETDLLTAGEYTLTISQTSRADATFVPEPGTLALFGLGLLGFGLVRRRNA